MTDRGLDNEYYVAPVEAPESRRPPLTEIGIISWLKKNLFSNVTDTILTLLTTAVVIAFLTSFLGWALFSAQWEIVFLNQRQIVNGNQFPVEETWRNLASGLIIVFLALLSIGVWGRIVRRLAYVFIALILLLILVPALTVTVPEPTVFTYADEDYDFRQVNFIAIQDQDYSFTIDPLTLSADFTVAGLAGYIENDNQTFDTSFTAFNETINEVVPIGAREQTRDPAEYDLSMAVQIWNNEGVIVGQSEFSKGTDTNFTYTWSLDDFTINVPEASSEDGETENGRAIYQQNEGALTEGWYTYTLVRDPDPAFNTRGVAWLRADNVEVFRSTIAATEDREATYGPPPELECNCGTQLNRTDMRYQGERTLAQWFSLQLAPYFLEIRGVLFLALLVGTIGYFMGRIFRSISIIDQESARPIERVLLIIAALWFVGYIGVQLTRTLNPEPVLSTFQTFITVSLLFTLFAYSLIQFGKGELKFTSRGVTLLWLISIPLILFILTGFTASSEAIAAEVEQPLPAIESSVYGGLLLTLLLSAAAIIVSFPIGILLALGRQSDLPLVSLLCTMFIEVFRGVPLITLLFMGSLILPFFGFGLGDVDLVIRIVVVLTFFTSAYMAEVIRGGLQIVQKGQIEASMALGLNRFYTTLFIILPQALRAVIPAIMGQAVSLFKDTSLVYLIGLFDITGVVYQILGDSQTGYLAYPREGYLYLGIIYFIISYMMADISRRIERTGSGAVRRDTI